MKKIIAFAAVLALFSAANVYAGETELKVVTPSGGVQKGDTFEVDIDVVKNTGFTSFDGLIEYDPSVIKLIGGGAKAGDALTYGDEDGTKVFLSQAFVYTMAGQIPPESDSFYDGRANGKDTAADIGAVKLANYVDKTDSQLKLLKITSTGTLCTLKFQAVGSGTTPIEVKNTLFSTVEPSERWHSDASASLTVSAGGSSNGETAAETSSEATTAAAARSGGGSGSSGGSGGGSSSAKTTSTTETTEAATTENVIAEQTVEPTTQESVTTEKKVSFSDLAGVSWAEPYINELASKGVINGYSDGTFKPDAPVKRCDFVVMLAKALDLPAGEDNFSDVAEGTYYAKAVSAAKAAKIVNGNTDGTFAPNSLITRQDMMVIAKGALEYAGIEINADASVLDSFSDSAQISAYAKPGAAAMINAGIISGSNGKIMPKSNTTRAQAAVMISKLCAQLS